MTPERTHAFAMKIAFDRLAARDRSSTELRQALEKKQVPAEVITAVLLKLEAQGLVDDQRFAHDWVQARHRSKGLARSVLARELNLKGIGDAPISVAIESLDAEDEWRRARELVSRRKQSLTRLEPDVQKRRLVSFLMRKGYPPHICFEVVGEALKVGDFPNHEFE